MFLALQIALVLTTPKPTAFKLLFDMPTSLGPAVWKDGHRVLADPKPLAKLNKLLAQFSRFSREIQLAAEEKLVKGYLDQFGKEEDPVDNLDPLKLDFLRRWMKKASILGDVDYLTMTPSGLVFLRDHEDPKAPVTNESPTKFAARALETVQNESFIVEFPKNYKGVE